MVDGHRRGIAMGDRNVDPLFVGVARRRSSGRVAGYACHVSENSAFDPAG